ncbi:MAG: hypothetical protein VW362_12985, partial [Candidatus Nanopelagicales bacterium]
MASSAGAEVVGAAQTVIGGVRFLADYERVGGTTVFHSTARTKQVESVAKRPASPVPQIERNRNPLGNVAPGDYPAGYVNDGVETGLLGTFFCPSVRGGEYFKGREGTPIGPLPMRHDAQVA